MPDQLTILTTGQLAKQWGCSGRTIARLCNEHGMPHTPRMHADGRLHYRSLDYAEVMAWIKPRMHLLSYLPDVGRRLRHELGLSPSTRAETSIAPNPLAGTIPDWPTAAHAVAQAVRVRLGASTGRPRFRSILSDPSGSQRKRIQARGLP